MAIALVVLAWLLACAVLALVVVFAGTRRRPEDDVPTWEEIARAYPYFLAPDQEPRTTKEQLRRVVRAALEDWQDAR